MSLLLALLLLISTNVSAATLDEYALLAYANKERADIGQLQLTWNNNLYNAAVEHSQDLADHGGNCPDLHNSCNGEFWTKRVGRYYSNWIALGENVAESTTDPKTLHDGWMASSGHRANILNSNFTEFGTAVRLGQTNFGKIAFATEDFGSRGALPIPIIPAAAVEPRIGSGQRDLLVNFSDTAPPNKVRAVIGNTCVDLPLLTGVATNGTYGLSRNFGNTCIPVLFEAVRSDGSKQHWPAVQAILVGADCDELGEAPTTVCDNGPTPTPSNVPTPTPDSNDVIDQSHVNHTQQKTILIGVISIPVGTNLITDISIDLDGTTIASFPASCIKKQGKGIVSKCAGPLIRLTANKVPSYRLRLEIPGKINGTKIKLTIGSLSWNNY